MGFDYRTSTGLGKQTLGGNDNTVCAPRPRRKEQWPHKRLSQTCLWVSRSLLRRRGLTAACRRVRGTDYSGPGTLVFRPCEGSHHYHHYPYHSLVSGQTTGREHSPTHQQKIGLKIYWAWPGPQSKTQLPLNPVPPIRKLEQVSYPHPSEGRQNENHNYRNLTKLITWITTFSNLMKLWAMPSRATQDGWSWWRESSDKT